MCSKTAGGFIDTLENGYKGNMKSAITSSHKSEYLCRYQMTDFNDVFMTAGYLMTLAKAEMGRSDTFT